MRKWIKHIFVLVLSISAYTSFGQMELVEKAFNFYNNGQLDSAKTNIDKGILDAEAAADYQAWIIKGFVYKELYKKDQSNDPSSGYREIAIESFKKALELDKGKEQEANTIQGIKFLGSKYKNDAIKLMDTTNYELSETLFEKYVNIYKTYDPSFSADTNRMQFYISFGLKFQDYFEVTNSEKMEQLAQSYYLRALKINPNSKIANKNYALLFYNQGVNIINSSDFDIDLEKLYLIQQQAVDLFKKAEPYLLKAYEIDSKDADVIEGLRNMYQSLNEPEKVEYYNKKYNELKK